MDFLKELSPILGLLVVITFVIARLPRVELGHSDEFRLRRVRNWLPVGLLYAFLYFGRYNLKVSQFAFGDLMTKTDFGDIFGIGTAVYGCAFLVNGPLTDRLGGKRAILIGGAGAALANLLMGLVALSGITAHFKLVFAILYAANMYFQSFGAVAIVKINAPWFHVRERGVFGAIFGILISLGIYFAYDVGGLITDHFAVQWVFLVPALLLFTMWIVVAVGVKDTPGEAGYDDFDTADASSGDDGPRKGALQVIRMMMTNPIIVTIALIEFCSGFLRQAIMQWGQDFGKETGTGGAWVFENWGMLLCVAGILGGVVAGIISDRVFGSRRGPVAAVLYGMMLAGSGVLFLVLGTPGTGVMVILLSMAVIGVHGMLSGTASMDFGGRRNAGIAVGIIDGFVYAGTAVQSVLLGHVLPRGARAADVSNWNVWPLVMMPVALIGLLLAIRVWHARPNDGAGGKGRPAPAPAQAPAAAVPRRPDASP